MAAAAILIALVIGARALIASRSAKLVLIAIALVPAGVLLSTWLVRNAPRARVNFAFVGYRVPISNVTTCGESRPKLTANGGVWIGGGQRREGDRTPDLIAIPGFRPHLLRVCSAGKSSQANSLTVQAVAAGTDLTGQAATDSHTQRVGLSGLGQATTEGGWAAGECLLAKGTRIEKSEIEDFAEREWKNDLQRMPWTRERLLGTLRGAPAPGTSAFCVDISSGKPQRCASELTDPRSAVFLWRVSGLLRNGWVGVAPEGIPSCDCKTGDVTSASRSVSIPLRVVTAGTIITDDERRELPGFEVRMISRRYAGGTADTDVARAASMFAPAPYRLGTRRQVRMAKSGSDLLVFVDEPQIQLRDDDLFGREVEALGQGELDLSFGGSTGREVLVVDLAAAADDLLPKPIFGQWISHLSIERDWTRYIERSTGSLPRGHKFGEIATFGSNALRVRPLVLVERVLPPRTTWLVPLAAALLLGAVIIVLVPRRYRFGVAWDLVAIVFFLLALRWMLSTRVKLDMPGAVGAVQDWIASGAHLFLVPPLVVCMSILLARYARAFGDPKETRPLWRIFLQRGTPPKGTADRLEIAAWWAVAAIAATAVWIAFACGTIGAAVAVIKPVVGPLAAGAAAAMLGLAVYVLLSRVQRPMQTAAAPQPQSAQPIPQPASPSPLARFDEAPSWKKKSPPKQKKSFRLQFPNPMTSMTRNEWFGIRPLGRWLVRSWAGLALLFGGAFLLGRFVLMCVGSQEELLFDIRTDVVFLPATAAALAVLSRQPGREERMRLVGIALFGALAFFGVGLMVNDLGLLWLGGMAIILCLPFVSQLPRYAVPIAALFFLLAFLSPKLVPGPFLRALEAREGTTTIGAAPNDISFRDELQVRRDRDHYRMLDTVQADLVEEIPSQLAREVVLDRERVRYQATAGAWRSGLRATGEAGSLWFGSGYLRSKPIVGHSTFRDAARSDYVYPLYVRSEFGLIGLAALTLIYVALFLVAPARDTTPGSSTRLGMWSLGLAAGTALFMIGGTSALFPFSGKWPLLLSIGSDSDLALGIALLILGGWEAD